MSRARPTRWAHPALLSAALLSCATGGRPAEERAAAFAHPEPDPACRATVQEPLRVNALERVTVEVGVDRAGRVEFVTFLAPDLTPAQALQVRSAFEQCLWRPAVGPNGEVVSGVAVLTVERERAPAR